MEAVQRFAIGGVRGQRLQPLILKQTSMQLIGSRLRDHIHNTASSAAELRVRTAGDHLKLLDGFEGNVDIPPLPAQLLTEESVVLVAAIPADVIEDPTSSVYVHLIATRPLLSAFPWCL